MKPSRYNIFVEDADVVLAVNLLSRSAVELSRNAYRVYEELATQQYNLCDHDELRSFLHMLVQNMFLLPDDFDEIAYIRERVYKAQFDRGELGLIIAPTMRCNFSCHYCFENKSDAVLDSEAQERLLKMIAPELINCEQLSVQWFGGEPLLALSIIENLSRELMRLSSVVRIRYKATIITNGYGLSLAVSRLLHELGIQSAQITLDGDRTLHDRIRRERRGDGSFDMILNNIKHASKYLSIALRVHVAPYSIANALRVIDELGKANIAGHLAEIYFAPIFNYHSGAKLGYATDGKRFMTARVFAEVQVELTRRAARWGLPISDFLDVPYGICSAVKANTLVVDAKGNLLRCYKDVGEVSEAIGTLSTGISAESNLSKWMDVNIPHDEECRSCKILPVCLGGCTKQWQQGATKAVICAPLKFNMADMIRLRFLTHDGMD